MEEYGYASEEALVEQYGEEYIKSIYENEQVLNMVIEQANITYSEQSQEGETPASDGETQEGETPAS